MSTYISYNHWNLKQSFKRMDLKKQVCDIRALLLNEVFLIRHESRIVYGIADDICYKGLSVNDQSVLYLLEAKQNLISQSLENIKHLKTQLEYIIATMSKSECLYCRNSLSLENKYAKCSQCMYDICPECYMEFYTGDCIDQSCILCANSIEIA